MCTKIVNKNGEQNIVLQCQKIFQSYAKITMRIIGDGLDLEQVKILGHKMELYQVQLLVPHHCKNL